MLKNKYDVFEAMLKEIEKKQSFFPDKTKIETIYFGGGTPSLLSVGEINHFLTKIFSLFNVDDLAEITLESNPDDLTKKYLSDLKKETKINRLSIGVQSFFIDDLRYMNRAHNAEEATQCIINAKEAGFNNLSVDLIYGTPTLNNENWKQNLKTLFDLQINHISCYALTVEDKTALSSLIEKKKIKAPCDEQTAAQFTILTEEMEQNNFVHYEISNFCKTPYYAKHNTNYWKGIPYLGIGPSAHSFDGERRYWNISNNANYYKKILNNEIVCEDEILSETEKYNEYVMTSIRTIFGTNAYKIKTEFGEEYLNHFLFEISPFTDNNWVQEDKKIFTLTKTGKLFCDYITTHLFFEND